MSVETLNINTVGTDRTDIYTDKKIVVFQRGRCIKSDPFFGKTERVQKKHSLIFWEIKKKGVGG